MPFPATLQTNCASLSPDTNATSDSLALSFAAVAMVISSALLPKHAVDFLKIIISCLYYCSFLLLFSPTHFTLSRTVCSDIVPGKMDHWNMLIWKRKQLHCFLHRQCACSNASDTERTWKGAMSATVKFWGSLVVWGQTLIWDQPWSVWEADCGLCGHSRPFLDLTVSSESDIYNNAV